MYSLIEDPLMCEFSITPNKEHCRKRWMDGSRYHYRIQKKWNKRHGVRKERNLLMAGSRIVAHPNTIKLIQDNVGRMCA